MFLEWTVRMYARMHVYVCISIYLIVSTYVLHHLHNSVDLQSNIEFDKQINPLSFSQSDALVGPLGEYSSDSTSSLSGESTSTPFRARKDKDKEDIKIAIAKLWTDFQSQAQKNVTTPNDVLAPADVLYPPLPCGTTSQPPMQMLTKESEWELTHSPVRLYTAQERLQNLGGFKGTQFTIVQHFIFPSFSSLHPVS